MYFNLTRPIHMVIYNNADLAHGAESIHRLSSNLLSRNFSSQILTTLARAYRSRTPHVYLLQPSPTTAEKHVEGIPPYLSTDSTPPSRYLECQKINYQK
jgi:hypothetical protein